MNKATLFYIHDPMCSWCWGFNKTWQVVKSALEEQVNIHYIVAGLAPDSDQVMPLEMQQTIPSYWKAIQKRIPGTEFNFDFWEKCQPRRSTYPACRAVLTAKTISPSKESEMILGIQNAYYLQAKNPSDIDILTNVATNIGIDKSTFERLINSAEIEQLLQDNIQFAQQLGAHGFPSLFLVFEKNEQQQKQQNPINIPINYTSPESIISAITSAQP